MSEIEISRRALLITAGVGATAVVFGMSTQPVSAAASPDAQDAAKVDRTAALEAWLVGTGLSRL